MISDLVLEKIVKKKKDAQEIRNFLENDRAHQGLSDAPIRSSTRSSEYFFFPLAGPARKVVEPRVSGSKVMILLVLLVVA